MLKGKIDADGILVIKRGAREKKCDCPEQPDSYCGDWCPLFDQNGEPPAVSQAGEFYVLKICKAELALAEFKDERSWINEPAKKS